MNYQFSRREFLSFFLGGTAAMAFSEFIPRRSICHTRREEIEMRGNMEILRTDVCVVGGGSGGFGAALAAARMGADVILVEKNQILGGNSTVAWVHNWEPSRGGGGIPRELWDVMDADPMATPIKQYREGEPRVGGKSLVWEPHSFVLATTKMLENTGKCQILFGTTFYDVVMDGRRVESILCICGGNLLKIEAPIFIDCTADGHLCVAAGCEYRMGEDAKSEFNEPNAPEKPGMHLNGLTLMYRITDTGQKQEPFLPTHVSKGSCPGGTAFFPCANGDVLINAVNMIPGNAVLHTDLSRMLREAVGLVYDNFYWMQTERGYETWSISGVAPEIGVRETRRIVGEHMLTENDVLQGVKNQEHEDIIAITDHAVDVHGPKSKLYEVPNGAYGVPYRCLLPKNTENLMIACRSASFTHIAASSCRLSRTMMTMGQAAGIAAAVCCAQKMTVRDMDIPALRKELAHQGVELE